MHQCIRHNGTKGLLLRLTGGESNTAVTFINSSNILVMHATFQGSVQHQTRAMLLEHSIATFRNCTFRENMGVSLGGGILVRERSKAQVLNSIFIKNTALLKGGAAFVNQSEFWVSETVFVNNSAKEGGGIYALKSSLNISSTDLISNLARVLGAAAVFENAEGNFSNITVMGNLAVAVAFCRSKANFTGTAIFKENINTALRVGGALFAEASTVSFFGNTLFQDNYAFIEGGAIAGFVQTTIFAGDTRFINNIAYLQGGAAVLLRMHVKSEMHGSVLFENNNCIRTTCFGGAISVTDASEVEIFDSVTFKNNSAQLGGAIYMRTSTIVLNPGARMESIDNYAKFFGGGIYHYDNINYYQCHFAMNARYSQIGIPLILLPECFLRFKNFSFTNAPLYQILSINDTAGRDGEFMYGGLMDKCIVDTHEIKIEYELLYNIVFKYKILQIHSFIESENLHAISSETFMLCFCESTKIECYGSVQISTYRGSRFNVSVLALSQGNVTTAPVILAKVSKTARLKLNQYSRQITAKCSTLFYSMYSTQENERLTIYPDKSCRDTGLAAAVINVTFLLCPTGLVQSGDGCVCEPRLQKYTNQCIFGEEENYQIKRKSSNRFWVGVSNNIKYGEGLILCQSCPTDHDYCQTDDVNISLADLDVQCAFNHSGLLCGFCAQNHI